MNIIALRKQNATIGFKLQEPRELRISLHNLQGETISVINSGEYFAAGECQYNMKTDNLSNGVYIVAITSE